MRTEGRLTSPPGSLRQGIAVALAMVCTMVVLVLSQHLFGDSLSGSASKAAVVGGLAASGIVVVWRARSATRTWRVGFALTGVAAGGVIGYALASVLYAARHGLHLTTDFVYPKQLPGGARSALYVTAITAGALVGVSRAWRASRSVGYGNGRYRDG
jgi:hypothetical protein